VFAPLQWSVTSCCCKPGTLAQRPQPNRRSPQQFVQRTHRPFRLETVRRRGARCRNSARPPPCLGSLKPLALQFVGFQFEVRFLIFLQNPKPCVCALNLAMHLLALRPRSPNSRIKPIARVRRRPLAGLFRKLFAPFAVSRIKTRFAVVLAHAPLRADHFLFFQLCRAHVERDVVSTKKTSSELTLNQSCLSPAHGTSPNTSPSSGSAGPVVPCKQGYAVVFISGSIRPKVFSAWVMQNQSQKLSAFSRTQFPREG